MWPIDSSRQGTWSESMEAPARPRSHRLDSVVLTSPCSDPGHEMATTSMPALLAWLGEKCHTLWEILRGSGYPVGIRGEDASAPSLKGHDQAWGVIIDAILAFGYKPAKGVTIALHPAASPLYRDIGYNLSESSQGNNTSGQLTALYQDWAKKYPMVSIEDGLAETDGDSFRRRAQAMSDTIQIVETGKGSRRGHIDTYNRELEIEHG